jgi:ketosteroid isomerase-like protein
MKKTIRFGLLLALASFAALINPLKAQDVKKELEGFTKKFEAAYNKQDGKTLKTFYTAEASRTNPAGETVTGNDNIIAEFSTQWADTKMTITIKPEKADSQADGSVITAGTYHVTGTTKAGEKIDRSGAYTNTVVKEGKQWKISKSVLTNL